MNKYRAIKTEYNGRIYDSKAEARWAMVYENMLRTGQIKEIEYQPSIQLLPKPNRIVYKPDFLLTWADGRKEYIDVKGVILPAFRLKQKMMAHFYPDKKLTIVK